MGFKVFFYLLPGFIFSQYIFSGYVRESVSKQPLYKVRILVSNTKQVYFTDEKGFFSIKSTQQIIQLQMHLKGFEVLKKNIDLLKKNNKINFFMKHLGFQQQNLKEVVLTERKKEFVLSQLKKVEGTTIYAGKKTEAVKISQIIGNIASNNARQIYNRIVGLNIYDNSVGGIQLNIGGRGLNPNRTQNFNTRQNGYDISADVLGYPESYYTPPPEALEKIEIIRGAASLQYGTQFGGLVNFKFKAPNKEKKISLVSRQSLGSYGLFTSFNSLSGGLGKFSYYTFYSHKQGKGFRPNSQFDSNNIFAHLNWDFTKKTSLSLEYTHLNYLAHQPGGLTDHQFYKDPFYSNRKRNWFAVDWNLYAVLFKHRFSDKTRISLNVFGLGASRKAIGFRENRVSQLDSGGARDLLVDRFSNFGGEFRFLHYYNLKNNISALLLGTKYYQAHNRQRQGPGKDNSDSDFRFANKDFEYYQRQASFTFPNKNWAFFGENVFNITPKWAVIPGFRVEYIKTESKGSYKNIVLDNTGNPFVNEDIPEHRKLDRSFVLFGIGSDYIISPEIKFYANLSQNYRSVTYNDIRVMNPSFQLDPNIKDESGYTLDFGLKGRVSDILSYDFNVFGLGYNNRIGEILKLATFSGFQRVVRYRGNIGDAFIYGIESFAELSLSELFFPFQDNIDANLFANTAFTHSEYIASEQPNVKGNEVEFIPYVNLKTGFDIRYKKLFCTLQYSYLSEQFSDASNEPQNLNDDQRGIEGVIPGYSIMDISFKYKYKKHWQIETGINNLLDAYYFTQRATGYPGPGIIPASPINWYTTLQFSF